jgi:hypothetical protein
VTRDTGFKLTQKGLTNVSGGGGGGGSGVRGPDAHEVAKKLQRAEVAWMVSRRTEWEAKKGLGGRIPFSNRILMLWLESVFHGLDHSDVVRGGVN